MENFELEGWEEINRNGGTIGPGINRAVHKLTIAIFNAGSKTSAQLIYLQENIDKLNKNLENSNKSSGDLTKALNRITFAGVIIAGIGVLVAIGNLIMDLCALK